MSTNTKIEWADKTWSPIIGCDRVSPGCDNCYAINTARIRESNPHSKIAAAFAGTTERNEDGIDWTGKVNLLGDRLDQPLHWKKPAKIFVNSMSDLFHDAVPDDFIVAVFARMWWSPQHTFQVLTKRHGRMRSLVPRIEQCLRKMGHDLELVHVPTPLRWPLPNVWLGVSVESQQWADIRIPALLDTPAAVRFLSCEPLLGPVDLTRIAAGSKQQPEMVYDALNQRYGVPGRWQAMSSARVDWVIVGGESGRRARPMHPDWARSVRDQCGAADVPFFLKQHGEWQPLGPLYGDLEDTDDGHMEAIHLEAVEGKRVIQLESSGYIAEGHQPGDSRTWLMARVGKGAAGRELDGRTHDAFPRDDYRDSITSGLTEDFEAFSRRLDAATDTARRG
ncbi:phage Gp37/Gp68 family protein [Streptomyces blattellae]|uniref:phage Gp37/Gp68 family protein n=1 Tax=Streptomyces blattellae TaxID=2569855 RepID=UPI0012B9D1B2|nr:phage Gp37/Gp68 family protein [Streptomyces blattellae]